MTQPNKTIVMLRTLSADEKTKQEAYYREKRIHDEVSALSSAREEGRAEGLKEKGYTEEQIRELLS